VHYRNSSCERTACDGYLVGEVVQLTAPVIGDDCGGVIALQIRVTSAQVLGTWRSPTVSAAVRYQMLFQQQTRLLRFYSRFV
jgi:hypothetical protein